MYFNKKETFFSISFFLTTRLRWRGLRNSLFLFCCCSWKTILNSNKKVDIYYTALLENLPDCGVSTKIVELNVSPRNLWKSEQLVHKNSEIHSVSTKLLDQRVLCSYVIALVSYKNVHWTLNKAFTTWWGLNLIEKKSSRIAESGFG